MSPLAELPRGIPIPVDEIRSALESAAIPGFTGSVQVVIGLRPEAAQYVTIAVIRRESRNVNRPTTTQQVLPDPERKKPVQRVVDSIMGKLMIRPIMTALEIQVVDGVAQEKFM